MIIGNPILLGGGSGDKFAVTFNAPKNSSVTYTGTRSGSVQVNIEGTASIMIPEGTYTFQSHLNLPSGPETTADTIIYEITTAINDNTTINLYPDNALYWYGISNIIWSYRITSSGVTFSEDDYALKITWDGTTLAGGQARGIFYTPTSVSFNGGGHTTIYYRAAYNNRHVGDNGTIWMPRVGYWYDEAPTSDSSTLTVSQQIADNQYGANAETTSVRISHNSGYVGAYAQYTSIFVYAIWLDKLAT